VPLNSLAKCRKDKLRTAKRHSSHYGLVYASA
jgi:hypothetical protein